MPLCRSSACSQYPPRGGGGGGGESTSVECLVSMTPLPRALSVMPPRSARPPGGSTCMPRYRTASLMLTTCEGRMACNSFKTTQQRYDGE